MAAWVLVSVVATAAGEARASVFGEENVPLMALVAQSASQLAKLSESIAMAKATLDETRRYVAMASEARAAFTEVAELGRSVIERPDEALKELFPDLSAIRAELEAPQSWRPVSGLEQGRVRLCLSEGGSCREFLERLSGQEAQAAIRSTFGVVAAEVRRDDIAAVDSEAAAGLAVASVQSAKAVVSRAQFDALLARCTGGEAAACQGAAHMAGILQAKGVADLNEQAAMANRLHATALAHQAAQEKRAVHEASQRARAVLRGFDDMGRSLVGGKGDGVPEGAAGPVGWPAGAGATSRGTTPWGGRGEVRAGPRVEAPR